MSVSLSIIIIMSVANRKLAEDKRKECIYLVVCWLAQEAEVAGV